MKLAVFAKRREVQETNPTTGAITLRPFYTYLSTLVNKVSGEVITVQLKFRQSCGAPDPAVCPRFIEVAKEDANLSWEKYTSEDGDELQSAKMWITRWEDAGEFIDHSLDEFDAFNS